MADDTTRWERVNEKPADKPAFSARKSTDTARESGAVPPRRSTRRHSRGRSGKSWYVIGVSLLVLLTLILAWQLFGS